MVSNASQPLTRCRIIVIDLGELSQIFSVRFIICEQGICQFIALSKHGSVFRILEDMEKN